MAPGLRLLARYNELNTSRAIVENVIQTGSVRISVHYPLSIGGRQRSVDRRIDVENPATGEIVGSVGSGNRKDAVQAIEAARDVARTWQQSDPHERERALHAVADRIENDVEEIARLLSRETGKCLGTAEDEIRETVSQFRFYAGVTDKIRGSTIPTPTDRFNYTRRAPYGVTAHIVPWNYPVLIGSRSIATALATGNTVVTKPPGSAPLSTMWYGEYLVDEFPDGVVNIVPGPGNEVGAELTENGDVDAISFTGSNRIGQRVIESAAKNIVPADVELGGKSPAIVLPDADPTEAGVGIATGIFSNTGQNCVATSRLIVHEEIKQAVVEEIVRQAESIELGPGTDPSTGMGPVISASAQKDMQAYVEMAKESGATLLTGGTIPNDPDLSDGHFFQPTVFDDVEPDDRIANEEIFGPILSVISVSTVEDAITVANDSRYALAASLWTERLEATTIADRLDHGVVAVNSFPVTMPQSPFGGNKESGIGREGGLEGVRAFTTVDSVIVDHSEMGTGYR